jgi:hypothetical protein
VDATDTDQDQAATDAAADAQRVIDAATLLRQHLHAAIPSAAQSPANDGGIDPRWRARLAELGQAVGLAERQEAELERLARSQLDLIREEIPRLLAELKPHFGTPQEAEAKHRYESGLRALRARLDRDTRDLLRALGLGPASA